MLHEKNLEPISRLYGNMQDGTIVTGGTIISVSANMHVYANETLVSFQENYLTIKRYKMPVI